MIEKGKNYVYGNVAEKLEYDVYEENKTLKQKKRYKSNKKVKFKAVLGILLIFAVCLVIMYRYALITELNYSYSKNEKIYNQLLAENSRLEVAIEKQTDLTRIRQIAEQELNMHKPDSCQIVYINVPKTDYTIVADRYKNIDNSRVNKSMFATILEKMSKISRIFY